MNPTRIKMSTTIANRLRRGALIASAIAATFLAHAQQTNAPSRLDYDSFRIISQRNIFNPNRSSRVASARTQERRVRTDNFVLRGTMLYRKGDFAFFDGSNSDLKKVCELSNKIAGYTVKAISLKSVTLEQDGKVFEMKIGAQMQREENGPWRLIPLDEWTPPPAEGTADSGNSSDPGGAAFEGNDVLKRLMEKRQQETK